MAWEHSRFPRAFALAAGLHALALAVAALVASRSVPPLASPRAPEPHLVWIDTRAIEVEETSLPPLEATRTGSDGASNEHAVDRAAIAFRVDARVAPSRARPGDSTLEPGAEPAPPAAE